MHLETRFHNLWMLNKFVTSDKDFTEANRWVLDYVAGGLANDMNNNKPDIMIVDDSPEFSFTGKRLDLLDYFSIYPHFREAWTHYRLVNTTNHCVLDGHSKLLERCKYNFYRRIE